MNRSYSSSALNLRRLVYAALYLAIAQVLPFVTGQVPEIGKMLCPMHIPVLLCGFLVGAPWGMAVGFIAPLLRSALFGMPTLFPGAVAMAFELMTYGGVAGLLRRLLPKNIGWTYVALILSMIAGRLVWGLVYVVIAGLGGAAFSGDAFLAGAVLNSIPGIILQLAIIPALVMALERAGLSLTGKI